MIGLLSLRPRTIHADARADDEISARASRQRIGIHLSLGRVSSFLFVFSYKCRAGSPTDSSHPNAQAERPRFWIAPPPWRLSMSKLTTTARKKLPPSDFALPGGRFPVEDKAHARDAKARASRSYNTGRLSASDKAKVDRKADAVLE